MSTSVDTVFTTAYIAEMKDVFQRRGSQLREAVRPKTEVIGSTAVFPTIGKGTATTKSRHGTITPMNQTHAAPSCTIADFYAGDWVDKLDEAKTNVNERDAIARGGAMALGRKVDDQITTVFDATTQTVITLTVTSKATILATALQFAEAAWDNDVPNDGMVFAAVTARYWSQLMLLEQFNRSEFVGTDGLKFVSGPASGYRWTNWMGIKWKMQTGLPGAGTATAKNFIWHYDSVGYAVAAAAGNVAGNDAVNNLMSGQACLIDDTGVIEGDVDDTVAIATS